MWKHIKHLWCFIVILCVEHFLPVKREVVKKTYRNIIDITLNKDKNDLIEQPVAPHINAARHRERERVKYACGVCVCVAERK